MAKGAVARAGVHDWAVWLAEATTARGALVQAQAAISAALTEDSRIRRAGRRDSWHTFVTLDIAAGGRRTFRWVRSPALQEPPPLVHTEAGLMGGGGG